MGVASVWTIRLPTGLMPPPPASTWVIAAAVVGISMVAATATATTTTATVIAVIATGIAIATVTATGITRTVAATIVKTAIGTTTTGIGTTTDGIGTGATAAALPLLVDATHLSTGGAAATPEAPLEAAARRVPGTMKHPLQAPLCLRPMGQPNHAGEEPLAIRECF